MHEEVSDLLSHAKEDRFSSAQEARRKAMDFLARREYGQTELVKKLASRGFDPGVAERAVASLAEEGLQSDRRFADSFVQSRISQGKGPVRIRVELAQRSLGDTAIEAAIAAAGTDWCQLASDIRHRKFGGDVPTDFKSKARQMRFLQYRGFEPDQIQRAIGAGDD